MKKQEKWLKDVDPKHLHVLAEADELTPVEACLELRVKHKCGTAHAYAVYFDVDEEQNPLDSDVLSADVVHLLDLLHENVAHGKVCINDRHYIVTETGFKDSIIAEYDKTLPIVELEPKTVAPELVKLEKHEWKLNVEQEVKPKTQAKPKGRRSKNERMEPSTTTDKPDDQGKQHDVPEDKGGDEVSA